MHSLQFVSRMCYPEHLHLQFPCNCQDPSPPSSTVSSSEATRHPRHPYGDYNRVGLPSDSFSPEVTLHANYPPTLAVIYLAALRPDTATNPFKVLRVTHPDISHISQKTSQNPNPSTQDLAQQHRLMPPQEHVRRPLRAHNKTRTGCKTCRRRKVKASANTS